MGARIDSDGITLSSGRTAYANCGIIGIGQDLGISQGYDGGIGWPPEEWHGQQLTADDMNELADLMIETWRKFKLTLVPK